MALSNEKVCLLKKKNNKKIFKIERKCHYDK